MRRWNGWGEDDVDYPLDPRAVGFLAERIGPSTSIGPETALEAVLAQIPASSWIDSGFDVSAATRLRWASPSC